MSIICQSEQWAENSPYIVLTIDEEQTPTQTYLYWTLEYVASEMIIGPGGGSKAYTVKMNDLGVKGGIYKIHGFEGTDVIATGCEVINKTTSTQLINFAARFHFNMVIDDVSVTSVMASADIEIPTITFYVIQYDPNGASYTPPMQTKWHGESIVLANGWSRTGYTFMGWATDYEGEAYYPGGATYSADASITLYAVWKPNEYVIKYHANGGIGAPADEIKYFGIPYYVSNVIPTKDMAEFRGWSTSISATNPSYLPGQEYTVLKNVTFYAVWTGTYSKPTVTVQKASTYRCDEAGKAKDDGTYFKLLFTWRTTMSFRSAVVEWEDSDGNKNSYTHLASQDYSYGGAITRVYGDGMISPDKSYTVRITVSDNGGSSYDFATIAGSKFPIDVYNKGDGIAFGKPAELEGVCDIAFKTRLLGGMYPVILEPEMDLNDVHTPGTYTGENVTAYNYVNCPVTSGTFTLIVESGGEHGQVRQTFISCDDLVPKRFVRFHYLSEWHDWMWAGTEEKVLFESTSISGDAGVIELSEATSRYRYIEIYYKDNAGYQGGYTKVYNLLGGQSICLSMQEATTNSVMFRQTKYTVATDNSTGKTRLTPDTATASYIQYINGNTAFNKSFGTNYLRIVRVIGRA